MKILLTGSNGFTGHHFRAVAGGAGHLVLPLKSNLTDKNAVSKEIAEIEPEAVVHLGAISFVGHGDSAAFYSVNVVGTTNLLNALGALPSKPSKVILASSANVYGNSEHSPITESVRPSPLNHYAASKLAMEHMASTYLNDLPIVITRPFNYTGPGQALNFVVPKLVDHFVRRAPAVELGNLHVEREFNDVRMVCEAYLALIEHGLPGETYNVCSGQPYSLGQLINTLQMLSGHSMEVRVNPAFVRANELHRLCGDPSKLTACVGPLNTYSLQDTLKSMLDAGTLSTNAA